MAVASVNRDVARAPVGTGLSLARLMLSWRLAFARGWLGRSRFRADRFVYVPPHLHLADPSVASDFLAGQIVLAGRSLLTGGRPLFELAPPSQGFAIALHSFEWLRHFDASADRSVRDGARRLVEQWLTRREAGKQPDAENPRSVPRRVISWITHSALLTEGADFAAYRRLLSHLARDAAMLSQLASDNTVGILRLEAAIALLFHALSLDRSASALRQTEAVLSDAFSACVAADGGTEDRSAGTAARLAADLIPALALYRARQIQPPGFLSTTLFRMTSFVRMLQQPDGGLALFNNSGGVSRDLVAEIVRFGSNRAPRIESAPESGFERLENDQAILIADSGRLPLPFFSGMAGASALAFEFSTKTDRLIVNCGMPAAADAAMLRSLRAAAAHSTILIDDDGLVGFRPVLNAFGETEDRVSGSEEGMPVQRHKSAGAEALVLGHAGLRSTRGYVVEREFTLLPEDGGLVGSDRVVDVSGQAETRRMTLVFHLHPRVVPVPFSRQDAVMLRLPHQVPGRDMWVFECAGIPLHLEESCCFEQDITQPRSQAIVIDVPISGTTEIRWRLLPYRA